VARKLAGWVVSRHAKVNVAAQVRDTDRKYRQLAT